MEFSGLAVSGRERVRIETVLEGRDLGLFKCGTCGVKTVSLSPAGQCIPCEMKFVTVDRVVIR